MPVVEGKSLLDTLRDAGVYVKSSCGGHARCRDCMVRIAEGADNLSEPTFEERGLLGNVFHITGERLSCQAKARGPVTVDLSGHEAESDERDLQRKTRKMRRGPRRDRPRPPRRGSPRG